MSENRLKTGHTTTRAFAEARSGPILLITSREVETQGIIHHMHKQFTYKFKPQFSDSQTFYDLGIIGGARIFMAQSEMGAGGPGGALLTIQEGIDRLAPCAVVMVGIAFGINPKKQRMGDILVSQQIFDYEMQRVGSNADGQPFILPRGPRPEASTWLLDRFKAGLLDWNGPKVHFGLILSGAKLIDNESYRDLLLKLEPEAIGGEMEGTGLYASAHRKRIDWILIKAIGDWADGQKHQKKNSRQQNAARNAAGFTIHVIKQGGFARKKEEFTHHSQ